MAHNTVVPIDVEHEVGVDDYFFSTTDRKGVIEEANSVFVRLSRYEHDQLHGAPHNIIRHPDMPGGAFKLVWDQIEAGRPACAYVKNMAADGGTYWVFATLMAVGDKYLSVRMKPLVTSLKDASNSLYEQVRPAELAARSDSGASRDEAATLGLGMLAEGLAPLGVTSADDLALTCLPLEVTEHERASSPLPQRPDATGPLADLLGVMHAIDARTSALVAQLAEYDALVSSLEASSRDAGPASDRLAQLVDTAGNGAQVEGVPEMIPEFTGRMTEFANDGIDKLANLDGTLSSLAHEVRWLRMRIALLRLHNRMVGMFCAELIDGNSTGDAVASLELLAQALADGAAELDASVNTVRTAIAGVPGEVEAAVRCADRTLRFATKWRGEAEAAEGDTAAALVPFVEALSANSATGFDELRRFYEVAARCAFLPDSYDHDALSEQVRRMDELVKAAAAA
ncbi:MAG: hypothetical protein Q4G51_04180 [Dermatophilus congolensis]|nr:hypothetical protein [Dermatophilus congolensis]